MRMGVHNGNKHNHRYEVSGPFNQASLASSSVSIVSASVGCWGG